MEDFILGSMGDGLIASAVMFTFMWLITNSKLANCNMVVALGSLLTRDKKSEFFVGLGVYTLGGVMFGLLYNLLLSEIYIDNPYFMIGASTFIGFVHGIVVSYAIIAIFSEKHHDPRFQNASLEIGVAHLFSHVVFGLVVGMMFAYRGMLWNSNFSYSPVCNLLA